MNLRLAKTKPGPVSPHIQAQIRPALISQLKLDVKIECDTARKARLRAAYEVVSHLVNNTNIEPGDYKISFKPEGGAGFIPINRHFKASDTVAFKIFSDSDMGITVGELRHKSFRSQVETTRVELGADPIQKIEVMHVPDLEAKLQHAIDGLQKPITSGGSLKLAWLLAITKKRQKERESLLLESCSGSAEKKARLDLELANYSAAVSSINRLVSESRSEPVSLPPYLPFKAAASVPLTGKEAQYLAESVNDDSRAHFLGIWAQQCAAGMKKSMGVDFLEYSTYDAIQELDGAITRIGMDTAQKGSEQNSFELKQYHLLKLMRELKNLVGGADRKIDALISKTNPSKEDIASIGELAEMRKSMLGILAEAYRAADSLHHAGYNSTHIKIIICTMAANLCKISELETATWAELAGHPGFKDMVSDLQKHLRYIRSRSTTLPSLKDELKAIEKSSGRLPKRLGEFLGLASTDQRAISALYESAMAGRGDFKGKLKAEETKLRGIFDEIKKLSPAVHYILAEALAESKSHNDYKMMRQLCADPYYYLAVPELLFSLAAVNRMDPYRARLAEYLQENVEIYDIISAAGLEKQVLDRLGAFLYMKEKAFDMESDPDSIRALGYTTREIPVYYRLGLGQVGVPSINLTFLGNTLSIPLLPLDYQSGAPSTKGLDEEIYGDRLDLYLYLKLSSNEELRSLSLGKIYESVVKNASTDFSRFQEVQSLLRHKSLKTGHFLSTLTASKKYAGCVLKGSGENPPQVLGMPNTMVEALGVIYPSDYRRHSDETFEFMLQKANIRLFREMNRELPYWISLASDRLHETAKGEISPFLGKLPIQ